MRHASNFTPTIPPLDRKKTLKPPPTIAETSQPHCRTSVDDGRPALDCRADALFTPFASGLSRLQSPQSPPSVVLHSVQKPSVHHQPPRWPDIHRALPLPLPSPPLPPHAHALGPKRRRRRRRRRNRAHRVADVIIATPCLWTPLPPPPSPTAGLLRRWSVPRISSTTACLTR